MFQGLAIDTSTLTAKKALIILVRASLFTAPVDQTDKDITVSRVNLLFFGNQEYNTVETPVNPNEQVVDAFANTQTIDHNLEMTGVTLGDLTKEQRKDIREDTWAVLVANPVTIAAMDGFTLNAVDFSAITIGEIFRAFEIYNNAKITFEGGPVYGGAPRTTFKVNRVLSDEIDSAYDNVDVELIA